MKGNLERGIVPTHVWFLTDSELLFYRSHNILASYLCISFLRNTVINLPQPKMSARQNLLTTHLFLLPIMVNVYPHCLCQLSTDTWPVQLQGPAENREHLSGSIFHFHTFPTKNSHQRAFPRCWFFPHQRKMSVPSAFSGNVVQVEGSSKVGMQVTYDKSALTFLSLQAFCICSTFCQECSGISISLNAGIQKVKGHSARINYQNHFQLTH